MGQYFLDLPLKDCSRLQTGSLLWYYGSEYSLCLCAVECAFANVGPRLCLPLLFAFLQSRPSPMCICWAQLDTNADFGALVSIDGF